MIYGSGLPEIDWTEFEEYLYNEAKSKHIPLSVGLELTPRCNLRCVHCYVGYHNRGLSMKEKGAHEELKTSEIHEIIDQLVVEQVLYLTLTGGEPLIRGDFEQIYKYAKNKGLLITLLTNGTLLTEEILALLSELPPKSIEISIYGVTEKTHESITKVPGSFKATIKAVKRLAREGFDLKLKTVVMQNNKHELEKMKDFATDLGISFRYSALIFPHLSGAKTVCKYRLSPKEVAAYDIEDPARRAAWEQMLEDMSPERSRVDYVFRCNAALSSFWIDPFGNLNACELARFPNYDLLRGSFKEGCEFLRHRIRSKKLDTMSECAKCEYRAICDQCPGWSQLEGKKESEKVDYLCQIAHLRAEGFRKKGIDFVR